MLSVHSPASLPQDVSIQVDIRRRWEQVIELDKSWNTEVEKLDVSEVNIMCRKSGPEILHISLRRHLVGQELRITMIIKFVLSGL